MSEQADRDRTKRQKMAAPGGRHDRIIRASRVVLPSIIGAMLAVLAFSPFAATNELSFMLDKKHVNMAKERMRITNALYRGEDGKGRPFTLRAGSAVQKSSAEPVLRMTNLSARLVLDEGLATILAANGRYDLDKETVRVQGPLSFESGKGYSMVVNDVELSLKNQNLQSFGPVNGRTKVGTFRANRLNADLDTRIVKLSGGAQLRIEQNAIR